MNNLKTMRDKLNGSIPMGFDENEELLKPITKEPVMKEFLNPDQGYKLVCCAIGETSIPENWIEVPKGSEKLTAYRLELVFWTVCGGYSWHTKNSTEWDDNKSFGLTNFDQYFDDETVILWQRETLNDKVASAEAARQKFIGAPFSDLPESDFEAVDDFIESNVEQGVKHAHYKKDISHLGTLDIYRVTELFNPHSCGAHIAKKALCSGQRGHKDLLTDIQDIIDTAERWKEMLIEDEKAK